MTKVVDGQHQDTPTVGDGREGTEEPDLPDVYPGSPVWVAVQQAVIAELTKAAQRQRAAQFKIHVDSIQRIASNIAGRIKLPTQRPALKFSEFVAEMYEVLREAREVCAVDNNGRNVELYFGDMMRRLEDAAEVVNDRITRRGGIVTGARP